MLCSFLIAKSILTTVDALLCFSHPSLFSSLNIVSGATGDGSTDDFPALQKCVDIHPHVFLPKGLFRISSTLQLQQVHFYTAVKPSTLYTLHNCIGALYPLHYALCTVPSICGVLSADEQAAAVMSVTAVRVYAFVCVFHM
jgi:hypothetical protein